MRTTILFVLSLTATIGSAAQPLVPGLRLRDGGAFEYSGVLFSIIHFDSNWANASQTQDARLDAGFPKQSAGAVEFRGTFTTKGGALALSQSLRALDNAGISYEAKLNSGQGVRTNALALMATLSAERYAGKPMLIDGKPLVLPAQFKQQTLFTAGNVKRVQVPTQGGSLVIEAQQLSVHIQDSRQFSSQQFDVRIGFMPGSGPITQASLQATIRQGGNEGGIALPPEVPVIIEANDQWRPIQHSHDVEPGSILDFSGFVDAPAGKYGHVVVKGPHFEFANRPGQRVRFFGTNLCFSANFPNKDEAEKLADQIARAGYNCVRLHHYDWDLIDKRAKDSVTLDAAQLDKLDHFIHCMKKRGLYINIDLYTYREARAYEIPEVNRPVRTGYKALVPLLDSAMNNWQQFARNVLTHKNPYTGMTLAEDPVLTGICPLNEDTLTVNIEGADVQKLYDERFEQWLKQKNLSPANADERGRLRLRFLTELQVDANRRAFAFLRGLGVKAPLTSVNFVTDIPLTVIRQELDFVDNHSYWDHPRFPERQWSLPHGYSNKSATADLANVPRGMFASRIVGKPFTVTEINFCFPNRYRAEAGPLTGAYAALQDWDGLFRFAHSHSINNTRKVEAARGFDLVNEPLSLLSERIAMLLFLRGDVAPAKRIVPYLVTPETAYPAAPGWGRASFPQAFSTLGLHTGIGSAFGQLPADAPIITGSPNLNPAAAGRARFIPADDKLAASLGAADAVNTASRRITSDTGQIMLDSGKGTLRIVSARSECFVIPDAGELAGDAVSLKNDGGFAVVSVSAMDDKPIATSNRLLIVHLTDLQNTKARYRNQSMVLMEQWGELPMLIRAGKAQVSIKLNDNRPASVWAVDMSGKRTAAMDVVRDGNTLRFTADTGRSVMAYELTRQ